MSKIRTRESRARRIAKRFALRLSKCRGENWYVLLDVRGRPLVDRRGWAAGLDIGQVEAYLAGRLLDAACTI